MGEYAMVLEIQLREIIIMSPSKIRRIAALNAYVLVLTKDEQWLKNNKPTFDLIINNNT